MESGSDSEFSLLMENSYEHSKIISDQVDLRWSIHEEALRIDIALVFHFPYENINLSNNEQTQQHPLFWVGFGMSEMGGTKGSDMFLFSFRHGKILDCHYGLVEDGFGAALPRIDECGQDWILRNYSFSKEKKSDVSNGDHHSENGTDEDDLFRLVVEVSRSLKAGDVNEDLPFLRDSSRAIPGTKIFMNWGGIIENHSAHHSEEDFLNLWSWMKPHSKESIVTESIRFFDDADASSEKAQIAHSQETLEFIDLIPSSPFHVPANTTTYKNFCFSIVELLANDASRDDNDRSWLLEDGAHIVKFEDIISGFSVNIVHHMDLHGTNNPILGRDSRLCNLWGDFVHPWEAGSDQTFSLPKSAGVPLGGKGGYLGFRIQVHYHNPNHVQGILDQSGVRIWYTRKKRRYDAGIMQLGDPKLVLGGLPTSFWPDDDMELDDTSDNDVGTITNKSAATAMQHSFYCPPACFSRERMSQQRPNFFSEGEDGAINENVVVFKEVMHMHSTGSRMTNIHLDALGNMKRISEINYFNFKQGAGYHVRQEPYTIDTGDSFVSTCYFENDIEQKVVFGSGSNEEMCQTFLWYYPAANTALDQENEPLFCGYWDASSREDAAVAMNDTSVHGCEGGYYASLVDNNMNRNYQPASETIKNGSNDSGVCQAAMPFGSWNARNIESYPNYANATLASWPSLQILIAGIPKDYEKNDEKGGNNTGSNKIPSDCSLCPDGSRPSHPSVSLEDYFGTPTTCDSLDAWITVLYLKPELVGYSWSDVPPCSEYYHTFGDLCGCRSATMYTTNPNAQLLFAVILIIAMVALLLFRNFSAIWSLCKSRNSTVLVVSPGDKHDTEERLSLTRYEEEIEIT